MLKSFRKPVFLTFAAMAAALFFAGQASANCVGATTTFGCGAVVTEDCTLNADMNCSTKHGLIVGAAGITIDGAGYKIDGSSGTRGCEVAFPDPHPCREEVDSGVYNAKAAGVANSGCTVYNDTPGEEGCDNVTIKNLEITGFCNGISMVGSCNAGPGVQPAAGDWLVGSTIMGNYIHDNGVSTEYNDGIYMAMAGNPAPAAGLTSALDVDCSAVPAANKNKIFGNLVVRQAGQGEEEAPSGNGINYMGGIEENAGATYYSACDIIANNTAIQNQLSGIMLTAGGVQVKVKGNVVKENGYGGITIPCDFNAGSTICGNFVQRNYGPGIGTNVWQYIQNNTVLESMEYLGPNLQFPMTGDGIYVAASEQAPHGTTVQGPSRVVDNFTAGNVNNDIEAATAASIDCSAYGQHYAGNTANTLGAAVPANCKRSGGWAFNINDIDYSGATNAGDITRYLDSTWTYGQQYRYSGRAMFSAQ